jgi:hypothetical protein
MNEAASERRIGPSDLNLDPLGSARTGDGRFEA